MRLVSRAVPPVQVFSVSIFQEKNMGLPSSSCRTPSRVAFTVSTVTTHSAETLGSRTDVAVMTHSPFSTPVTRPLASTVAMAGSLVLQVTERSVAVQGSTEAERLAELPRRIVSCVAERLMPETSSVGADQSPPEVFSGMIKQDSSSHRSL